MPALTPAYRTVILAHKLTRTLARRVSPDVAPRARQLQMRVVNGYRESTLFWRRPLIVRLKVITDFPGTGPTTVHVGYPEDTGSDWGDLVTCISAITRCAQAASGPCRQKPTLPSTGINVVIFGPTTDARGVDVFLYLGRKQATFEMVFDRMLDQPEARSWVNACLHNVLAAVASHAQHDPSAPARGQVLRTST